MVKATKLQPLVQRRGSWKPVIGDCCVGQSIADDSFPRAVKAAMKACSVPKPPGQRGSGDARRANHPPNGYKEITETMGNKITSALGGEDVPSVTRMMRRCESREEAAMSTPSLLPRQPHCLVNGTSGP